MSREDPIIVQINKDKVRYSASSGQDVKRQVRNADVVINNENIVIRERAGLGYRAATQDELLKARQVSI